jgi:hypothetical protein
MQDYEQALELDPTNETIKSRISVIHNEFGVAAYQEKRFSVRQSIIHVVLTLVMLNILN